MKNLVIVAVICMVCLFFTNFSQGQDGVKLVDIRGLARPVTLEEEAQSIESTIQAVHNNTGSGPAYPVSPVFPSPGVLVAVPLAGFFRIGPEYEVYYITTESIPPGSYITCKFVNANGDEWGNMLTYYFDFQVEPGIGFRVWKGEPGSFMPIGYVRIEVFVTMNRVLTMSYTDIPSFVVDSRSTSPTTLYGADEYTKEGRKIRLNGIYRSTPYTQIQYGWYTVKKEAVTVTATEITIDVAKDSKLNFISGRQIVTVCQDGECDTTLVRHR